MPLGQAADPAFTPTLYLTRQVSGAGDFELSNVRSVHLHSSPLAMSIQITLSVFCSRYHVFPLSAMLSHLVFRASSGTVVTNLTYAASPRAYPPSFGVMAPRTLLQVRLDPISDPRRKLAQSLYPPIRSWSRRPEAGSSHACLTARALARQPGPDHG